MVSEGIPLAEARIHLQLQSNIMRFLQTSTITSLPYFNELYVRHKPFQIVLSFNHDVPQTIVRALVPQTFQNFIVVETNGVSQAAQKQFMSTLNNVLAPAKAGIAMGYSPSKKDVLCRYS